MGDVKNYDWPRTFSFNAGVNLICAPRGIGKTYGLRWAAMEEHFNKGRTWVEVVRHKSTLDMIEHRYFDRLQALYPDYDYKIEKHVGYVSPKGEKSYRVCMYFAALSSSQMLKLATFSGVNKIVFDEFTLDRSNMQYTRYLKNEFDLLANLVDTVTRQREHDGTEPHLYLLGNSLDAANPFFYRYGIYDPKPGYTWYEKKTVLLHYVKDADYAAQKARGTLAGRMLSGSAAGSVAIENDFDTATFDGFIERKKPANAKLMCVIVFRGMHLRIWSSFSDYIIYVDECKKGDRKHGNAPVYYLLKNDGTVDRYALTRASNVVKSIMRMYYANLIRYSDRFVQSNFLDFLQQFGVR